MYYDLKVQHVQLPPGDLELIQRVGLTGKQTFADISDKEPYSWKVSQYRIFLCMKYSKNIAEEEQDRNMLLPFSGLPIPSECRPAEPTRKWIVIVSDDPSDRQFQQFDRRAIWCNRKTVPRYEIPQTRNKILEELTEIIPSGSDKKPTETEIMPRDIISQRVILMFLRLTLPDLQVLFKSRCGEDQDKDIHHSGWDQHRSYTVPVDPSHITSCEALDNRRVIEWLIQSPSRNDVSLGGGGVIVLSLIFDVHVFYSILLFVSFLNISAAFCLMDVFTLIQYGLITRIPLSSILDIHLSHFNCFTFSRVIMQYIYLNIWIYGILTYPIG